MTSHPGLSNNNFLGPVYFVLSSTQNKVAAILMYMMAEACLVMRDDLKQELTERLLLNQLKCWFT